MDIREAIIAVTSPTDLSKEQTREVFTQIMEGAATDAQIAALIVALRCKGETVDEVTGAAIVMREKVTTVLPETREHLVDTCGTGGDASGTFNISTAAALVAAGAGARVAKHGNRSVSSRSGSADVLEALGVTVTQDPAVMKRCLDTAGICFLFAPALHKAMKYAAGPRKEVGIRTVFNILGPLTNPARADAQVLGVFAPDLTELLGQVLANLGSRHAFVVHGEDRIDEVSISAPTRITEVRDGNVSTSVFTPESAGIQRASRDDLLGGDPADNARIITKLLSGVPGPCRDIVVLNAAFALVAAGLSRTVREGIGRAAEAIDTGAAAGKLEALKRTSAAA